MQSGQKVTSLDELQDIDELCVVEVREYAVCMFKPDLIMVHGVPCNTLEVLGKSSPTCSYGLASWAGLDAYKHSMYELFAQLQGQEAPAGSSAAATEVALRGRLGNAFRMAWLVAVQGLSASLASLPTVRSACTSSACDTCAALIAYDRSTTCVAHEGISPRSFHVLPPCMPAAGVASTSATTTPDGEYRTQVSRGCCYAC